MYNDKYIKTKINLRNGKVNTTFYGNKTPKENKCRACLSAILLDSAVKVDEKCYPQTFFEECKYTVKK